MEAMESFSNETVSYMSFQERFRVNTQQKKITIRQTINSLLEIYDLTDHNNDENVDKNEKAHKKTKLYRPREENSQDIFTSIKFSMFGWTEGDEEQSNERDLPESLTRSQEFWFNFINKERRNLILWMSVTSLLVTLPPLFSILSFRSRAASYDGHRTEIAYMSADGQLETTILPITYEMRIQTVAYILEITLGIMLITGVGLLSGLKTSYSNKSACINWLKKFQRYGIFIYLVYISVYIGFICMDFTTVLHDRDSKRMLSLSMEAEQYVRKITVQEALEYVSKISFIMASSLLVNIPVPSIWWAPVNGLTSFAILLYFSFTRVLYITDDTRFRTVVIIIAFMYPITSTINAIRHIQIEVLSLY